MTLLAILLTYFLAASLAAVAILALVLNHKQTERWMTAFGQQYGITVTSTDDKATSESVAARLKPRKKLVSIPIPGADFLKQVNGSTRNGSRIAQ